MADDLEHRRACAPDLRAQLVEPGQVVRGDVPPVGVLGYQREDPRAHAADDDRNRPEWNGKLARVTDTEELALVLDRCTRPQRLEYDEELAEPPRPRRGRRVPETEHRVLVGHRPRPDPELEPPARGVVE